MRLFDEYERTDTSRSPQSEDIFSFLNRSARRDVRNIRAEFELWLESYPASDRTALISRFRDRRQHDSAWWELYLHRLFTLLGFNVQVHPELDRVTTHPDFLVTGPKGEFLLEAATTAAGIVEFGRDGTRAGWLIDALNAAPHPNFCIGLWFRKVGRERPGDTEVAGPVTAWLDELDPDEVMTTNSFPEREFSFRDWRIFLRAMPKRPERRGTREDDLLIGFGPVTSGFVDDHARLRRKLRDKSSKYGEPGSPIVIAINLISTFGDEIEVERALFGSIVMRVAIEGDELTAGETFRKQDGFWIRNGQPRATRVSAVLVGPALHPWTIVKKWPHLWLNPWAVHTLDLDIPLPRRVGYKNGQVEYLATESTPANLFHLADDWPGPTT